MNFNRKPAKPKVDPERPASVEVDGDGLKAWDERRARGEVDIPSVDVLGDNTGNGGRNGRYVLNLRWPTPKEELF